MPERPEDVLDDDFFHDEVAAGDIDRLHLLDDGFPDQRLDGFPVLQHPLEVRHCQAFVLEWPVQRLHGGMVHGPQGAGVHRFQYFVLGA